MNPRRRATGDRMGSTHGIEGKLRMSLANCKSQARKLTPDQMGSGRTLPLAGESVEGQERAWPSWG